MRHALPLVLSLSLMCVAPRASRGQSTSRVGHTERAFQLEVSGGVAPANDNYIYRGGSNVRAGAIGLRWATPDGSGLRLSVWGTDASGTLSYTAYNANGQYSDSMQRTERMVALVGSADYTVRIAWDLMGSLSVGGGVVPYAHGSQVSNGTGPYGTQSSTSTGALFSASLALRYRWLFIEQHAMAINGADREIQRSRELAPLMLGIRIM